MDRLCCEICDNHLVMTISELDLNTGTLVNKPLKITLVLLTNKKRRFF